MGITIFGIGDINDIIELAKSTASIGDTIAVLISMWVLYLLPEWGGRFVLKYQMRRQRRRIPYFKNSFIKRVFLVGYKGCVSRFHIVVHAMLLICLLFVTVSSILQIVLMNQQIYFVRISTLCIHILTIINLFIWIREI